MKCKSFLFVITLVTIVIIYGKVVFSPQFVKAASSGLLVHYSFDEQDGITAIDSSGNDHNGRIILASRVPGKTGNGLLFGADNARVGVAEFLEFMNGKITVEAWIYPSRIENGETYRIIGGYDYDGTYFQIRDGRLEVCYNGASYHYGTTQILAGVWTRIVFTSDGSDIKTYINSVLDKSSNISLPVHTIGNVLLGAHMIYKGGNPLLDYVEEFPGVIDELKIWERSGITSPVISGKAPIFTRPNKAYSFTPSALDLDEDLNFSIIGKPSWASFSNTTGRVNGTPTTADIGLYGPIVITVQDSDMNTDSLMPFTINVTLDGLSLTGVHGLLLKE